jgi:hypothetical protein
MSPAPARRDDRSAADLIGRRWRGYGLSILSFVIFVYPVRRFSWYPAGITYYE